MAVRIHNLPMECKSVVVTHGTDTMIETAEYLAKQTILKIQDKAIILTGMSSKFDSTKYCMTLLGIKFRVNVA